MENLGTHTYDTTLTNQGYGYYSLSFPQFTSDSGMLLSVKLTANVTANYGFSLRNSDNKTGTFQLNIGQEDQFTGGLGDHYLNITPQYVGTYTLAPGETRTVAPFRFLTNHRSTDSITAGIGPFLGHGSIHINYMSFLYTNLWVSDHTAYNFTGTVNSTTRVSMQYLFCKTGIILATEIVRWTAVLRAPLTTQLDWSVTNETGDRRYEIQRSSDGRSYTTIAEIPAGAVSGSADYSFTDHLPENGADRWYYRLQMHDHDQYSWSAVREVSVDATGEGLHIYPNPATDHIDIATGTVNSDWVVDILSVSGGLVQQANFSQSNLLHLSFDRRLATGTYFLRATDLRGQRVLVSSFIVR